MPVTIEHDVADDEDSRYSQNVTGGWVASMQHHFVTAAVPPTGEEYHFTLGTEDDHALLTYRGPLKAVPAGTTGRFSEKLFVGPKLQEQLKQDGFSGLRVQDETLIFDTQDVRSTSAMFDPDNETSKKILAGVVGASALFPQEVEESLKKMVPKLSLDRTGALQVL